MSSINVQGENVLFATAGYDHTIKFWQPHTGICYKSFNHPDSQVNALRITPDRHQIAAAGYQQVRFFDINSNNQNPVNKFEDIKKNVSSVGFNKEGKWMYTGGEDGCAMIWDLRMRNQTCQRRLEVEAQINCVCLHPNQVDLFVGDQSGAITIWNLTSDRNAKFVPENGASILSIAIDGEGHHMAAVNDKGRCYMWALTRGQEPTSNQVSTKPHPKMKIDAHNKYALKCLFSPDSTLLVTTSADTSMRIWKTIDFSCVCEMTLPGSAQRWVWDCAFSDDSQYILSASSDTFARLWNVESGKVEKVYEGHSKALTSLAFTDA